MRNFNGYAKPISARRRATTYDTTQEIGARELRIGTSPRSGTYGRGCLVKRCKQALKHGGIALNGPGRQICQQIDLARVQLGIQRGVMRKSFYPQRVGLQSYPGIIDLV